MDEEATRTRLVEDVQARAQSHRYPGTVVLICGAGKSDREEAAADLAERLGVGLWRIDLAQVVDKYVGETERNLTRLLTAAEQMDGVLLFDEADALFGRRTEVAWSRGARARATTRAWSLMSGRTGLSLLAVADPANLDPVLRGRAHHEVLVRRGGGDVLSGATASV